MYTNDIKTIVEHIREQIATMREQVKGGSIHSVLVKNTMENLRSVLDYVASDLNERIKSKAGAKTVPKPYFPYGRDKKKFEESLAKNLPSLNQIFPEISGLIESVQPYSDKQGGWLADLCDLTNEAKHNNLTKSAVEKVATVSHPLFFGSGRGITIRDNYYTSGQRTDDVYVSQDGDVSIVRHSGDSWAIVENRILFEDRKIEILPFMDLCLAKIETLTKQIEQHI